MSGISFLRENIGSRVIGKKKNQFLFYFIYFVHIVVVISFRNEEQMPRTKFNEYWRRILFLYCWILSWQKIFFWIFRKLFATFLKNKKKIKTIQNFDRRWRNNERKMKIVKQSILNWKIIFISKLGNLEISVQNLGLFIQNLKV